jgi:hypothetical protein
MPVVSGQVIDLHTLALGEHTLTVYARDSSYNQASDSVTFIVIATPFSLRASLDRLYAEGKISNWGNYVSLVKSLESFYRMLAKGNLFTARVMLEAFIQKVENQSGIHITPEAAALLVADARWVLDHLGEMSAAAFDLSSYTSPYKDVFLPISIH